MNNINWHGKKGEKESGGHCERDEFTAGWSSSAEMLVERIGWHFFEDISFHFDRSITIIKIQIRIFSQPFDTLFTKNYICVTVCGLFLSFHFSHFRIHLWPIVIQLCSRLNMFSRIHWLSTSFWAEVEEPFHHQSLSNARDHFVN